MFDDSNRNNLANIKSGLNLQLLDANLKDKRNADKLAFYKEADADSLKRGELLRNDPYYKDSTSNTPNAIQTDTGNLYSSASYSGRRVETF